MVAAVGFLNVRMSQPGEDRRTRSQSRALSFTTPGGDFETSNSPTRTEVMTDFVPKKGGPNGRKREYNGKKNAGRKIKRDTKTSDTSLKNNSNDGWMLSRMLDPVLCLHPRGELIQAYQNLPSRNSVKRPTTCLPT